MHAQQRVATPQSLSTWVKGSYRNRQCPQGSEVPDDRVLLLRVAILGIIVMVLGRYLVVGYLSIAAGIKHLVAH